MQWAEGTGGTATSGTDYAGISGGTLTFSAGTTSRTFNVSVMGDSTDEADETVVVTLSSPGNATIGAGTGNRHHLRRRPAAVAVDQLAERSGGRRRLGDADLYRIAERSQRQAGDGELRARQHGRRHGDFGHGLCGPGRGNADVRGRRHRADHRRVGNRRQRRRGRRDRPHRPRQSEQRHGYADRHRHHQGRRHGAGAGGGYDLANRHGRLCRRLERVARHGGLSGAVASRRRGVERGAAGGAAGGVVVGTESTAWSRASTSCACWACGAAT